MHFGRGHRVDLQLAVRAVAREGGPNASPFVGQLLLVGQRNQRTSRAALRVTAVHSITVFGRRVHRSVGTDRNGWVRPAHTSEGAKRPPNRRDLGEGSWLRKKTRL